MSKHITSANWEEQRINDRITCKKITSPGTSGKYGLAIGRSMKIYFRSFEHREMNIKKYEDIFGDIELINLS